MARPVAATMSTNSLSDLRLNGLRMICSGARKRRSASAISRSWEIARSPCVALKHRDRVALGTHVVVHAVARIEDGEIVGPERLGEADAYRARVVLDRAPAEPILQPV